MQTYSFKSYNLKLPNEKNLYSEIARLEVNIIYSYYSSANIYSCVSYATNIQHLCLSSDIGDNFSLINSILICLLIPNLNNINESHKFSSTIADFPFDLILI